MDVTMQQSCDDATEEDSDDIELQPGIVLTRLSEMVRKKYFTYLENLLSDNYKAWCLNEGHITPQEIQKCAELLEEKAIKACVMVQFYRKAMIKIIANIRRNTNECRLESQLKSLIEQRSNEKSFTHKCVQTEDTCFEENEKKSIETAQSDYNDFTSALQEKINNFQQKLVKKTAVAVAEVRSNSNPAKYSSHNHIKRKRLMSPEYRKDIKHKSRRKKTVSPCPITSPALVTSPLLVSSAVPEVVVPEDDVIAKELAQLFSEERTEIDDIFGFKTGEPSDDPQIDSILKEIESAKLSHERKSDEAKESTTKLSSQNKTLECNTSLSVRDTDSILRESLWPCELHMQQQTLSNILARLIDEDFRWYEIIQWKFFTLFGEDSDDEFAVYSPTIELNEVIIGSCMKRIAPWMVKHLMRPLNDGLIGNRFLFKKLAKSLSRSIVMQNQYPDEKLIKETVEDFFCLHQCVMSLRDFENIN